MAVPLSLIFTAQSVIVVVAFAVVIWLLTDQQHKDLQQAIFSNIDQRQKVTANKILAPFAQYETPVARLGERLLAFPNLRCDANTTHASATDYFNSVVLDVTDDTFVRFISQFGEERDYRRSDGNPAWGGCTMSPTYVNVAGRNRQTMGYIVDKLPITFDRIQSGFETDYASLSTVGHLRNKTYPNWTPGEMFPNPNRHGEPELYISFNYPLAFDMNVQTTESNVTGDAPNRNITTWGIVLDLTMTSVGQVAADAKIATGSKVMLYEMSTQQLLATSLSIPLLNANVPWDMFNTPDREMNAAVKEATAKCSNAVRVSDDAGGGEHQTSPPCSTMTYLTTDSVISVHYLRTSSDINMLLLQVTPEYYFFGESRKTRLNGILVGAGAAVIVVITCIIIWLAVYRPLNTLQDNMELAANLQNDRAEANSCFLYEIAVLNDSFEKMNNRLLQARAFLPQALLVGGDGSGDSFDDEEDEEGNGDGDEEDDSEGGLDKDEEMVSQQRGGGRSPRKERAAAAVDTQSRRSAQSHRGGGDRHNNKDANRNNRNGRGGQDNASDTSSMRSVAKHNRDNQNNNHHNNGHGKHKYTLTLARAITSRRIGILVVNGRGFHRLVAEPSANLAQLHQDLIELVEGSAKAEKGVIDAFNGDHFVITFNAALAVAAPAKGAALCAIRIQNSVGVRTALPGVTMGLSTGMAMVGSLGSSDTKKFCMITPAFTQAVALEMSAKQVIGVASCLFSMKVAGDLDMHVYSQLVGQKLLCGTNINAALEDKVVNIGGVMGPITTQGDEWLYELEEGASKNPYARMNAAFELFFAGKLDVCAGILAQGYPETADPCMAANWHRLTEILNTGSLDWQL